MAPTAIRERRRTLRYRNLLVRQMVQMRTCLLNAATTTAVSLLGTLISMRKRECRSTSVAM